MTGIEHPAQGGSRTFRGFTLDTFQLQAIQAIEAGQSVVVAAPTGAGKTLIAEYAIQLAMERQRQIVYTAPIKALSNQKFRDFRASYGPDAVGLMTGDVVLNHRAPLVIMTTEIFRNTLFDDPARLEDVQGVIFDEIHFLDDLERGTVWEESLIFSPRHLQVVALSATIPNLEDFIGWLGWVREAPVVAVQSDHRPVPLEHWFFVPGAGLVPEAELSRACDRVRRRRRRVPAHDRSRGRQEARHLSRVLDHVIEVDELPCLVFSFSRAACEAFAAEACQRSLLERQAERQILRHYDDLCTRYQLEHDGKAQDLRRLVRRGIAYHHAGMVPALKEVVERLFTTGCLQLIFTTETFAVGINMPARSVVFSGLRKFDGRSFRTLRTRDYFQMAGRAGRRGIDARGTVYSVVDTDDLRPPEVRRLAQGTYEPVVSRFDLSYSSILNLWEHLRGRIFTAVDRSFGAYQAGPARREKLQRRLEARLRVLRRTGYLVDEEITRKGRLAASIFGYEIQLTELEHGGLLERLPPQLLAVLLVCLAYEPRRGDWFRHGDRRRYQRLFRDACARLEVFQEEELQAGLQDVVRLPELRMAPTAMAWVRGCDLEDLRRYTSCDGGDLVRLLRSANQMLRNLSRLAARRARAGFHERLERARELVNRAEVDAEAQLTVE